MLETNTSGKYETQVYLKPIDLVDIIQSLRLCERVSILRA